MSSRTAPPTRLLPPSSTRRTDDRRRTRRRARFHLEALEVRSLLSTVWTQAGPGPIINGQDENINSTAGPNPIAGAVEAVAPVVTTASYAGDANTLYVATVNGGVWKTTNATNADPVWTSLTDNAGFPSLSFNSLAISPLNSSVIFAGSGRWSSYANDGGPNFGIARSTDAGAHWTVSNFTGANVRRIVPTTTTVGGNEVVVAGTSAGVYRSTDGGTTYTSVTNGIPLGNITDLAGDPGVDGRVYAAMGGDIYRSNDAGASWTKIDGSGYGALVNARVLLAVHHDASNDDLYAMVIGTSGSLSGVYRSADQGATYTNLGVPSPSAFPGGQGGLHGALVADPTDANTVYLAGDRQNSPFPNSLGANNYSANVWRNVAGTWQNLVANGANGTSPHADSRSLAFDETGNLLFGSDGGVYKLVNPNGTTNTGHTGTRVWVSMNNNIVPTEAHSVAYDSNSHIVFSGNQDAGTSIQIAPGSPVWNDFLEGDGGIVGVTPDPNNAAQSIRYVGFTGMPAYRLTYDAANNFVTYQQIGLNITSGGGSGLNIYNYDPNIQFYNPYATNPIDPNRVLFGTANIYESTNKGDSLTNLGFLGFYVGDGFGNSPIAYGGIDPNGTANAGVFYVAGGPQLWYRSGDGQAVTKIASPDGNSNIRAVVMDPHNDAHVFFVDENNKVFGSFDSGKTWTDLTANLGGLSTSVRTIQIFSPDNTPKNTVLLAGGQNGIYQLRRPGSSGAAWTSIGTGIPQGVLVYDLKYNYTDNVLVAGTLGRGVWELAGYFRGGGGTGIGGIFAGPVGPQAPGAGSGTTPGAFAPPTPAPKALMTTPGKPVDPTLTGVTTTPVAPVLGGVHVTTASSAPAAGTSVPATGVTYGATVVSRTATPLAGFVNARRVVNQPIDAPKLGATGGLFD